MPFDVTNHFMVSLAYKAAVIHLMLNEASFFAEKLHLQEHVPIAVKDISANVNPPLRGGLGSFETAAYFYSFPGEGRFLSLTNENGTRFSYPERGKLAYIERKDPFKRYASTFEETFAALAKLPSLIDTNGAYRLATQWLAVISVDMAGVERAYKAETTQEFYYDPPLTPDDASLVAKGRPPPPGHRMIKLPVFNVTWGGTTDGNPDVSVRVFGATKELIQLRMENTTFLRRALIAITNALELNSQQRPQGKIMRGKAADDPVLQEVIDFLENDQRRP
jgi:hypothetical protein